MGPNDVELVRVFTRMPGETIGDLTFPSTSNIDVVVEAEHGAALLGMAYQCGVIVRDLEDNQNIDVAVGTNPVTGAIGMGGDPWAAPGHQFPFTVPAANIALLAGHVCEVVAYMKVGAGPATDISFATSPRFIIEP